MPKMPWECLVQEGRVLLNLGEGENTLTLDLGREEAREVGTALILGSIKQDDGRVGGGSDG